MEAQTRLPPSIFERLLYEEQCTEQENIPSLPVSPSPPLMLRPPPILRTSSCNLHSCPQDVVTDAPSTPPFEGADKEELADGDDGSVASKLLGAIGKSNSSPSLSSCCKEVVRETPYQKSLKLKRMQLHHCTEELGSESCISSCSAPCITDTLDPNPSTLLVSNRTRSLNSPPIFCLPTRALPWSPDNGLLRKQSFLTLVNYCISRDNRDDKLDVINRLAMFPPPLDILSPPVSISDAPSMLSANAVTDENGNENARDDDGVFLVTLRSCKRDGRFMLKEVKVPIPSACVKASRSNNRLMLRLNMPVRFAETAISSIDAQLDASLINLRSSELKSAPQTGSDVAPIANGGFPPFEGGEASMEEYESAPLVNCSQPDLIAFGGEPQAMSYTTVPVSGLGVVSDSCCNPVQVDSQLASTVAAARLSDSADPQSNSITQPGEQDAHSQLDQDEEIKMLDPHSKESLLLACPKEMECTRADQSVNPLNGEGNVLSCTQITSNCSKNKKGMHYHGFHAHLNIHCVATTS